jgi:hypothetical protein
MRITEVSAQHQLSLKSSRPKQRRRRRSQELLCRSLPRSLGGYSATHSINTPRLWRSGIMEFASSIELVHAAVLPHRRLKFNAQRDSTESEGHRHPAFRDSITRTSALTFRSPCRMDLFPSDWTFIDLIRRSGKLFLNPRRRIPSI